MINLLLLIHSLTSCFEIVAQSALGVVVGFRSRRYDSVVSPHAKQLVTPIGITEPYISIAIMSEGEM